MLPTWQRTGGPWHTIIRLKCVEARQCDTKGTHSSPKPALCPIIRYTYEEFTSLKNIRNAHSFTPTGINFISLTVTAYRMSAGPHACGGNKNQHGSAAGSHLAAAG